MEQYIPKSALVAEITKIYDRNRSNGYIDVCDEIDDILSFIDTLEVKEVDLEEEIERVRKTHFINDDFEKATLEGRQITNIAKHFFELGLNASNPLTWEDMILIHKCIKDAMNYHLYKMMEGIEGQKVVYEEVLKRFKEFKERKEK